MLTLKIEQQQSGSRYSVPLPSDLPGALFFQGFSFYVVDFITLTTHFALLCQIKYQNIHENMNLKSEKIISQS